MRRIGRIPKLLATFFVGLGLFAGQLAASPAQRQRRAPEWQAQVREYAKVRDWDSAMSLVNQEIARAPEDMDIRAWRARVLAWSGQLFKAESEYQQILRISAEDPDDWMGLAGVYLREGKIREASEAIDTAVEQDPTRADVHAARARVLRAAGDRNEAKSEFQKALELDPASKEARDGLASLWTEPKSELRLGEDTDLLSYAPGYLHAWTSLSTRWTSNWSTSLVGDFYDRSGTAARKFTAGLTWRQPRWGAVTVGGGAGQDNTVVPRSEAFFDWDRGWKTGETFLVRGVEFDYGQHWYWFPSARILSLNGTATLYLPRDWTLTLEGIGARSAFSGTGSEWRPSGLSRIGFPLLHCGERRLSGNLYFAAGTEDFAVVDQIGRFASQTYGGELKFQFSARQDLTGYAGYQRRTQNRTDTSFGISYGIHF